ncbi:MAG: glycosyltransferase family 2 protein [Planctomycetes bacterium]|nr:glycosyltransferase family 2 protein [Planctomycetota bacterium]
MIEPSSPDSGSIDVSIIIVSYNTKSYTLKCLETLRAETRDLTYEVILLDNASEDGSPEAIAESYPTVRLIASRDNLGFARGNNEAAKSARGEWVLLLNPDTEVLDGAIQKMVAFARAQSGEVVVGGRTLFADRSLNPTSCWRFATPWSLFCSAVGLSSLLGGFDLFNRDAMVTWRRDSVRPVDIVTGCFLLLRRELWERLGGFDGVFFMYGEDADLCRRAQREGARCLICPDATIIHHAGVSEQVRSGKMIRLFTAKSQLYDRYWRPGSAWLARRLLSLWCLTRMGAHGLLGPVRPRSRNSFRTWREVWRGRSAWIHASAPLSPPVDRSASR